MKKLQKFLACLLCMLMIAPSALAVEQGFSLYHGSRDEHRICITVDDLSDTAMLEAFFNLSQEMGIPMTFFTLGYVIHDEDAELWRAIAESDCEIGNHTYYHNSLPLMTHSAIVSTLTQVQDRLDEVLGYHYPMQVMRPPYGNVRIGDGSNIQVLRAVEAAGYSHAVLWDVSQTDPALCIGDVQNGSILLFHTLQKDLDCLNILLPQLVEQGYEFVTVSEMAGMPPVEIVYPEAAEPEE